MPVFDLFSKRQKRLRGEIPDVYTYDEIPNKLRIQIAHIIQDALGSDNYYSKEASQMYALIHDALCREYGQFTLTNQHYDHPSEHVMNFMLGTKNVEEVIDIVEVAFKIIDIIIRPRFYNYKQEAAAKIDPDAAIEELNARFKEHGIGYAFEGGEVIRVDSTLMHSEVTKPTIALLWNKKFAGANEEYMKAHEHYRHGKNKECLTECLKAFESTMKIICSEKDWVYNENDPAKKLIQICLDNGLIPSFVQNQFTSLKSLLESGIPTIRNKLGGHGQGQVPRKVDDEMTRYALNLTGANIIFLIEQSGIKDN